MIGCSIKIPSSSKFLLLSFSVERGIHILAVLYKLQYNGGDKVPCLFTTGLKINAFNKSLIYFLPPLSSCLSKFPSTPSKVFFHKFNRAENFCIYLSTQFSIWSVKKCWKFIELKKQFSPNERVQTLSPPTGFLAYDLYSWVIKNFTLSIL